MSTNPDGLLRAYHALEAQTDERALDVHKQLAEKFVNGFCDYVHDNFGLHLEPICQGSSFEGIKIGKPDEFDFLVVFLESNQRNEFVKEYPHPLAKEVEDYKSLSGKLKCYRAIMMPPRQRNSNPLYEGMTGSWRGNSGQYECLSARKAIEEFKKLMRNYKDAIAKGKVPPIPGIAEIDIAKSGYPNVKVVLERNDDQGTKINIDISPAVRFDRSPQYEEQEYYIAKKHPTIKNVRMDHLELLWLSCYSPQERDNIQQKPAVEKRNYRIVKSLLGAYVPNAYIWKTLFMLADEPLPESPVAFMYQMIVRFQGALYAELIKRGHEVPNQVQDSYNNLLYSKFNRCENVLARFNDSEIWRWFDEFTGLRDLLDNRQHMQLFKKTMGLEKTNLMEGSADMY